MDAGTKVVTSFRHKRLKLLESVDDDVIRTLKCVAKLNAHHGRKRACEALSGADLADGELLSWLISYTGRTPFTGSFVESSDCGTRKQHIPEGIGQRRT